MHRSTRRGATILALLTLAFAALSATAGPASGVTIPPHGHIYNGDSPRCLDSGTPADAQLWTCTDVSYQKWLYTGNSTIAANSTGGGGGCLDAGAGLNGSLVHVAACSGATSQKWFWTGSEIISQATGRCLDADLGTIGFEQACNVARRNRAE